MPIQVPGQPRQLPDGVLAAEPVRGILGGLPRFFPIAAILLCRPYRSDPVVSVLLYRSLVVADPG